MGELLMLKLYGRLPVLNAVNHDTYLITVTTHAELPRVLRKNRALLTELPNPPKGFKAILTRAEAPRTCEVESDIFQIADAYDYFTDGDIIRLDPASGAM